MLSTVKTFRRTNKQTKLKTNQIRGVKSKIDSQMTLETLG